MLWGPLEIMRTSITSCCIVQALCLDFTGVTVLYWKVQVTTRMFGYPSDLHNNTRRTALLPVLDMANCADKGMKRVHGLAAGSCCQK
jgi:hypothetical protein